MTEDDNYKKQTGNGNDGENYVNNKDNNNSNIYIYIYIYIWSLRIDFFRFTVLDTQK